MVMGSTVQNVMQIERIRLMKIHCTLYKKMYIFELEM